MQEVKGLVWGGDTRGNCFQASAFGAYSCRECLVAPTPMPTHDALVPLAEICGGLPAAGPLLGTPGEVSWFHTTTLPGIWVSSPGGLAWCPLVVPSVDRGASSILFLSQNEWEPEIGGL